MNYAQALELIERKKLERIVKGLAVRVGEHDRYPATQESKKAFIEYHESRGRTVTEIKL